MFLRLIAALIFTGLAACSQAQSFYLPYAPLPMASFDGARESTANWAESSSSADLVRPYEVSFDGDAMQASTPTQGASREDSRGQSRTDEPVDANGNPIPLEHWQPQRILGFMPNFRSVSAGSAPHPPGWKYNFKIATRQATDYSSFIFLGLTSLTAKAVDEHPSLGKGPGGLWAYTWRGFVDKTDGTYISAWFLASLLREDTRFYALGNEHSIPIRALYVISLQGVARTYGGRQTPNIAGLGGKVLTQLVSRTYYPAGATSFSVLATKFGYSAMRDVAFTSIREFYPDVAAHFVKKHREKLARLAAQTNAAAVEQ